MLVGLNFNQKKVPREESIKHIGNIFSKKDVMNRVDLIVLAGLDRHEFSKYLDFFMKECECNKKRFIQMPFLFPTNYPKIREKIINDNFNEAISNTYSKWLTE